jgi:hypothetical protein
LTLLKKNIWKLQPPPRYNTRARARHHSANQAQFLDQRIFRPIAFTNNQYITVTSTQAPNPISMANAVINHDTGASLEYRHLIQDETTFPVWNKAAANEFGRLAQGVGGRIEGSNTIFFNPTQCSAQRQIFHLWTVCGGHRSQQN